MRNPAEPSEEGAKELSGLIKVVDVAIMSARSIASILVFLKARSQYFARSPSGSRHQRSRRAPRRDRSRSRSRRFRSCRCFLRRCRKHRQTPPSAAEPLWPLAHSTSFRSAPSEARRIINESTRARVN